MYVSAKVAAVAIVILIARPAWGSGDEWRMRPKPAQTSVFQANLTPIINESPLAPTSVRNLPLSTERPGVNGLLASTTWLKGAFSTETEVTANQAILPAADHSTRLTRLAVTGSAGLVRYGMRFRNAAQGFNQQTGQGVREAWGEWSIGTMALRSAIGQQWTYLQGDAAQDRAKQSYNRIDVSWKKGAWPHLAFSYAQNTANTTMDPLNFYPQKASPQSLEAAVGYSGGIWDAKLASAYGIETDLLNHGAESQIRTQTMTTSLRPIPTLTVTPSLGYRAERPEWANTRIDAPSASLTMSYRQSQRMSITAVGNYFGLRSTDKLIDLDSIGGKGIVSWELEPLRDWKPQLSLEGGYHLQVNRLMPYAQTENISGLLRLVLATM
jgi:hypothetical protein